MVIGTLVFGCSAAVGVAHFVFGEPIRDRHSGNVLSDAAIAAFLAPMLIGPLLFIAAGLALRRWTRD
jgi:hypothetical protein